MNAQSVEKLFSLSSENFKNFNIKSIIERYEYVCNKFEAYIKGFKLSTNGAESDLMELVQFMRNLYKLKWKFIYLEVNAYDVKMWGNLYWEFFHLTSILLQEAIYNKTTDNICNFATIIYNLEEYIPCNVCSHHFLNEVKGNIENILRQLSVGDLIVAVYVLHNKVSENINRNSMNNVKQLFSASDFRNLYKCYPGNLLEVKKTEHVSYLRVPVNWETDIHFNITKLLSFNYLVPYLNMSRIVKKFYGIIDKRQVPVDLNICLDYIENELTLNEMLNTLEYILTKKTFKLVVYKSSVINEKVVKDEELEPYKDEINGYIDFLLNVINDEKNEKSSIKGNLKRLFKKDKQQQQSNDAKDCIKPKPMDVQNNNQEKLSSSNPINANVTFSRKK